MGSPTAGISAGGDHYGLKIECVGTLKNILDRREAVWKCPRLVEGTGGGLRQYPEGSFWDIYLAVSSVLPGSRASFKAITTTQQLDGTRVAERKGLLKENTTSVRIALMALDQKGECPYCITTTFSLPRDAVRDLAQRSTQLLLTLDFNHGNRFKGATSDREGYHSLKITLGDGSENVRELDSQSLKMLNSRVPPLLAAFDLFVRLHRKPQLVELREFPVPVPFLAPEGEAVGLMRSFHDEGESADGSMSEVPATPALWGGLEWGIQEASDPLAVGGPLENSGFALPLDRVAEGAWGGYPGDPVTSHPPDPRDIEEELVNFNLDNLLQAGPPVADPFDPFAYL